MTIQADLPDWSSFITPDMLTANAFAVGAWFSGHLVHITNPFRVWGAWLNVWVGSTAGYPAGFSNWGAKISVIGGTDLIKITCDVMAASQIQNQALFINLGGLQVPLSGGFFTVDFTTEAGIGNLNSNANGGIIYSEP